MKRIAILVVIIHFFTLCFSQTNIEKYRDSVRMDKIDTVRAYHLYLLSYYYQNYKPDSALILAEEAYRLSVKTKFLRGEIGSLGQIATSYARMGDFSTALAKYLEQLKLIETKKDPYDIASAYLKIALVYNSQKDLVNSLFYAYKADSIAALPAVIKSDPALRLYTLLDLGEIFSTANRLDSAIHYTRLCYYESIRNDTLIPGGTKSISGTALNNMGNIYFKAANFNEALMYYENSIPYLDFTQDYNTLAECYFGIAQSFDKKNSVDSALSYARKSFDLATENKFLKHAVNASILIGKLFKDQGNPDSAYAFQQTYIILKDSLESTEKIKQLESLTLRESARQQKIADDEKLAAKERRLRLELLFVGMFIPILFIITAFIAGRRVNKRVIKFSGIFSLLFLFEYITLLLHPWVMEKTGHSPVFEILIFVAIAAIISPTHHRIENWLINLLNLRHQIRINKANASKAAAIEKEKAAAEARALATAKIVSDEQAKVQQTK